MKPKMIKAFMECTETFAKLSTAERSKVGCIIVKDNRVLSIGYNGTPPGWDNKCEWTCEDGKGYDTGNTKPWVIHAEANCLAKMAKANDSSDGAVMFVTLSPCIECAKQIMAAGIKNVYYKEAYRCSDGIEFLEKCGINVYQVKEERE